MRVQNLLGLGIMVALAAACSNPANEETAGSEASLLSELEPALFSTAAGTATPVLSALELSPSDRAVAVPTATTPRPATRPTVVNALADMKEPEATIVVPAPVAIADEVTVGTVAVAEADEHAGHGSAEEPRTGGGVMIRGGFGGRDPCIIHPGAAIGLEGIAGMGGIGRGGAAASLGPMGALINDRTPGVGRTASASYPGANRTPMRGGGRGGSVFIR